MKDFISAYERLINIKFGPDAEAEKERRRRLAANNNYNLWNSYVQLSPLTAVGYSSHFLNLASKLFSPTRISK